MSKDDYIVLCIYCVYLVGTRSVMVQYGAVSQVSVGRMQWIHQVLIFLE